MDKSAIDTKGYAVNRKVSPVRVLRVSFGLTQAELAAAAGVSRATVIAAEKGDGPPRLRTARALAHVLRCEVFDLFPELLLGADQ